MYNALSFATSKNVVNKKLTRREMYYIITMLLLKAGALSIALNLEYAVSRIPF